MWLQGLDECCRAIQDTLLSQHWVATQADVEAAASGLRTTFVGPTGAILSGRPMGDIAGTWAPGPPKGLAPKRQQVEPSTVINGQGTAA